ncbi:MAG: Uncharacterized protein G01um101493_218 [Microgenomates group bacterium Gr01-1014_93]|nr:MAG: Uncharacterized protein G01um101493_218 [Microgenomates group bacterium Gr01-1014_93]
MALFGFFKDTEGILPEDIARWMKNPPELFYIENYLANRIFYPGTIAEKQRDHELELSILREFLKSYGYGFYQIKEARFIIPVKFADYFGNLSQLIWAYLDVFKPKGLIKVYIKNQKFHPVGTVLVPEIKGRALIELIIENKKYSIKSGNLTVIPCIKSHCDIHFYSKNSSILGKNDQSIEVFGGNLGIVIDSRGEKI